MDYQKLFGDTLASKNGPVPTSQLSGKVVGLYFSAHWCPPCRMFTPKLRQTYLQVKAAGKDFEVVFCSFDRSQRDFEEYFGTMPWLAVPFDKSDVRNALGDMFNVSGIPTLLLMDDTGVYNSDGRTSVMMNPQGFPWK